MRIFDPKARGLNPNMCCLTSKSTMLICIQFWCYLKFHFGFYDLLFWLFVDEDHSLWDDWRGRHLRRRRLDFPRNDQIQVIYIVITQVNHY